MAALNNRAKKSVGKVNRKVGEDLKNVETISNLVDDVSNITSDAVSPLRKAFYTTGILVVVTIFSFVVWNNMIHREGERGEPGTAEHLEERMRKLEDSFLKSQKFMKNMLNSEICYMGVKNRYIIPDSQITASSFDGPSYQAYYGRLDNVDRSGGKYAVWIPGRSAIGEWHQVYFKAPKPIGGIVTQGRARNDNWVRSFKISYGNSTSAMITIQENGSDKIFTGNNDRRTKVTNMFPNVIICRYIRVYPQTWYGHMCMRLEYIDGMCHGLL
uniref:lactadherin-like n=1 Tax=Styela clava TaxID=7725 RepID=UPI001939E4F7|nr:lactadherin-like [Styela clava]